MNPCTKTLICLPKPLGMSPLGSACQPFPRVYTVRAIRIERDGDVDVVASDLGRPVVDRAVRRALGVEALRILRTPLDETVNRVEGLLQSASAMFNGT